MTLGFQGASQQLMDSLQSIYENNKKKDTSYVKVINDLTMEYLNANQLNAQDLISEAMRLSDSLEYNSGMFWATVNRGNAFWYAGMYDAALNSFFRASQLTDEKMAFPRLAVYNNIGEVFKRKYQFDSALVYLNLAKDLATELNMRSEEVLLLYNISELYLKLDDVNQAERFINQSVEKIAATTNPRFEAYAWFGMGAVAERKEQLEQAIEYHLKAFEIRNTIKDVPGQINSLNNLATLYRKQNNLTLADQTIAESLNLSELTNNKNFISQTYLVKAELLQATNRFEEANEWLLKHFAMKDSVDQKAFTDQTERIKSALNAEIKEKSFELLEERQLVQNEVIKRQTWIIISVSALTVILFGIFFNYRRSLRQQKKYSESLSELNQIILSKNKKIEQINAALDHQLIHTTKLLYESQRIAKIESWEYHFEENTVLWTGETFDNLSISDHLENTVNDRIKNYINKESYERVVGILKASDKDGLVDEEDIKVSADDGVDHFFRIRYFIDRTEDKIIRAYGSSQDITDLIKTEEKEKSIISSLFDLSRSANLSLVSYDFEQFAGYLLHQALKILEVQGAIFWRYDAAEEKLRCLKVQGVAEVEEGMELSMKSFPNYFQRLLDYRTTPVSDLSRDTKTQHFNEQFCAPRHIRSSLESNVEIEGEIIGLLSVMHNQTKKWTYSEQRYVGSLTDIIASAYSSDLKKQLEQEKGDLIRKLLKRNKNLEELTYVISHHLRGPLTRIIGFSKLYNDPKSAGIQGEIMNRINRSSLELDQVIKDLIKIIKYGDTEEIKEQIPLKKLVEDALEVVALEWQYIDHQTELSIHKDLKLYGNVSQLQNILHALLSNAFKFRRKDRVLEIRINIRRIAGMIQIAVADNGQGIDLSKFDTKIFKMYQQFHADTSGTGIGLFITKNLVESIGGSITVSSLPMDGTVFTIELPDKAPRSLNEMKLTAIA